MIIRIATLALLCLTSCNLKKEFSGGKISNEGTYYYKNLTIVVDDSDNGVDYFMLDSKGDTLIRSDEKFSSFQRWALHLDKDQTLWVFSSDIGDASWNQDLVTGKYRKRQYFELISKDSIPEDVYNTLKEFYPYNLRK